jgi:energy-coupling factor transporter ATP-binding protein EcfA2
MSRDALVVGINTYSYERLKGLTAPAIDAEAVAKLLEGYGEFNVKRLPAVKDKQNNTIRVGQKTEVTLTQLEDAIAQLFKPEGRNIPDTALLYFSGHGLRKSRGGIHQGYLATSDVNPDLGNWGLSLQWLRQLLQSSEVKQQIIWLDCCYSGELLNFAEADPGDRGKGRDRCFIAASREFEPAFEEIGTNHSVLTTALLQALEPRENQQRVTNYTVVDVIDQNLPKFPQRPIFANSGGIIHLTRIQTKIEPVGEISENVVASDICPYRGLQYFDFTEADAKYFYGRQAITDTLIEKVRQSNFLAVLGASGSGKSSVVRAGLLYQLQQGRKLSGSDTWQLRIFRPGERPSQSLAQAFLDGELSDIQRASQLGQAEELINKGSQGLGQLIDAASSERVVLVLDQFEEVFTLCQNSQERQHFFDCLLTALQRCGRKFCLVLTMRADFFGKCAEYAELAAKIQENLLTVTPMNRQELEQAIIAPAKQVNLTVESELVEQIIDDMGDSPGILPLLQYTLTEIWQQRTGEGKLTLATYSRLGGVKGTLQKRATEVYEGLSGEEQEAAKRIFLELTQLGEETEDTRRRVLLRDVVTSSHVEQVMQKLADARLIVTQEEFVDVAHEALIRHWLLLREWLDENRDRLREKRKIEAAAEEWRSFNKRKDYLLRGGQLKKAKTWQKGEGGKLGLSHLGEEFIKASNKHRQRELLLTASWLTIPMLIAFVAIIPYQRRANEQKAWDTVGSRGMGTREALELLTEGCQKHESLPWIPDYLLTLLFGGCSNFSYTKLNNADLSNGKLSGVYFLGTNLSFADLSFADLRGTKLIGASLPLAKLSGANLSNAYLMNANLNYADLSDANLRGADLNYASFIGSNLSNANLEGSDLSNVRNLTPEQVKAAKNWEKAKYSYEFRKKLGLK